MKDIKGFTFPFSNDDNQNECFIKSCLIYKLLYEKNFNKRITFLDIMYKLNDGIFEIFFRSNSNVLKNHLIFHYAFTKFYNAYKKGRGSLYLFDSKIKSSVVGFITGIIYWFFHKGAIEV